MPDEAVIDQVTEAVDHVSPETADLSTTPLEPAGPSRSDRIKALTGKARDHYQRTGNVEQAEAKMARAAERAAETNSGAESAQTEGVSEPPPLEQQPRASRNEHNFRKVKQELDAKDRELIAARAKLELYERQSAAGGPSAPATERQPEKPATSEDPRPEVPDIDAFDDPKKYNAAVKEWQKKDTEWINRQFDRKLTGEQQRQQSQQSSQKWTEQIDSARKIHKDFDTVALSDKTPVSYATMALIQGMADGALRSYALGRNIEVATKIAELTHIPGENQHKDFASFMKWVKADPDRAMLYGEKLATARSELAKLSIPRASGNAAPPQKPLKEIIRSASRPSAEVNTDDSAAPPQDPMVRVLANIKAGVKGAQAEYNRLKNEADLRKRKGR